MKMNKEDSLKKRYFYKIFSNILSMVSRVIILLILPKALGPESLGNYNFLTNFFQNFFGLIDSGTSQAFFVSLSKRKSDRRLIRFYMYASITILLSGIIFTSCTIYFNFAKRLWPNQNINLIYLALIFGFSNWFVHVLLKLSDAVGLTVKAELLRAFVKLSSVFVLIWLYYSSKLWISTYFIFNISVLLILILLLSFIFRKENIIITDLKRSSGLPFFSKYAINFWEYCHPLLSYNIITILIGILDIWLLQFFSGSKEQGFFGLSYQISALSMIFVTAMIPLATKEISYAFSKNNTQKMKFLFKRISRFLYFTAAYFSLFVAVRPQDFIHFFGGNAFTGALPALTLMLIYPLHQVYGQLNGSVFYSTNNTRIYRNIGVITNSSGLLLSYLFLAPTQYFGLDLGAFGLALKLVLIQMISTNVQLYFSCRIVKASYFKAILHQIFVPMFFVTIAFLCSRLFLFSNSLIINIIISGFFYTLITIISIFLFPQIIGISKKELYNYINVVKRHKA